MYHAGYILAGGSHPCGLDGVDLQGRVGGNMEAGRQGGREGGRLLLLSGCLPVTHGSPVSLSLSLSTADKGWTFGGMRAGAGWR